MQEHYSVAIVPSNNLEESEVFYRRLGFDVLSDYGHYRILSDSKGWHLHLTKVDGWPRSVEDNPFGLYLYVDDVDAIADRVRDMIINPEAPFTKPWGTYEFAISDPTGLLVRVGKVIE